VTHDEIERRFRTALEQAGLLKQAAVLDPVEVSLAETDVSLGKDTDTVVEESKGSKPEPVAHLQDKPRKVTLINLFQHPDAHAFVLDMALLRQYGPEWMEWEPETLRLRIPHDFPTTAVSDLNMDKIQAAKALHYVNGFWLDWDIFLPCTMSFNGLYPDFHIMQVPTVAQCAVSVDMANRIRDDVVWSDEVKAYLDAVHRFDGILCPIHPLDFVEVNTEGLPIDCEEINKLWPEVRRTGKAPTEESVTAEQLRRMLIVQGALEESRTQLQAQLPLLLNA